MSEPELELYGIVGKMFRQIREEKGHTLEYVSEYLGITPKSLQRYECGERRIKIEIIKSFCNFYNINCSNFMKEAKLQFVSDYPLSHYASTKTDSQIQIVVDKAKKLNPEGLTKLIEYADDLVASGKYEKFVKKEEAI